MEIKVDSRFRAQVKVGEITVRALSDLDTFTRRRIALETSAEEREEFGNTESDKYKELVEGPINEADDSMMREAILSLERVDIANNAEELLPFPYIPFPDGATLEERHEVIKKREEVEDAVRAQRLKYIEGRINKLREKVVGWDTDLLERELVHRIIESWVWAKYQEVFQYQTLVLSCFKDGEPLFSSWEDVRDYSDKFVKRLFAAYRQVDSIDVWELEKNSLTEPSMDLSET